VVRDRVIGKWSFVINRFCFSVTVFVYHVQVPDGEEILLCVVSE